MAYPKRGTTHDGDGVCTICFGCCIFCASRLDYTIWFTEYSVFGQLSFLEINCDLKRTSNTFRTNFDVKWRAAIRVVRRFFILNAEIV